MIRNLFFLLLNVLLFFFPKEAIAQTSDSLPQNNASTIYGTENFVVSGGAAIITADNHVAVTAATISKATSRVTKKTVKKLPKPVFKEKREEDVKPPLSLVYCVPAGSQHYLLSAAAISQAMTPSDFNFRLLAVLLALIIANVVLEVTNALTIPKLNISILELRVKFWWGRPPPDFF